VGDELMFRSEVHACFQCGSELDKTKIVYKKEPSKKYKQLFDKDGIEIHTTNVICRCGLTQVYDAMDEESVALYYKVPELGKSEYRKMFNLIPMQAHDHMLNALKFIHMCMGRDNVLLQAKSFLEIGGANIGSWDTIKNVFPFINECYGLDPGIPKTTPNILDDLGNQKFDIITILNTLEHMFNPKEALLSLRKNMTENSRIVIAVPNLINSALFTSMDAWFSAAHLYHFEMDSLLTLILSCGFEPVMGFVTVEGIGEKLYICVSKSVIPDEERIIEMRSIEYLEKRIVFIKQLSDILNLKEEILNESKKL
jgi:Methyltransferase domain